MNGVRGMQAWRWLFLLEGLPSCACAVLAYFFYPDFPETATWLSDEERYLATERIKGIASLGHARITWAEARETLLDRRLYLHYYVYLALAVSLSSVALFTPTIVSGLGYQGLQAQLFTVPPYAVGVVVTVSVAWQSDKHGLRMWGAFMALTVAGVSFLVQGQSQVFVGIFVTHLSLGALPPESFKARYALLCLAVAFSFGSAPPLLSWLTANLHNTGASTLAVALNVSLAQIGQIIGMDHRHQCDWTMLKDHCRSLHL